MKKALFQCDEACLLVCFQMCKEEVVKQESAFRLQFVLDKYQVAFREIAFPPVKDAVELGEHASSASSVPSWKGEACKSRASEGSVKGRLSSSTPVLFSIKQIVTTQRDGGK